MPAADRAAAGLDAALTRAAGGAVRDDPRRVAKALRRAERAKAKRAAAWAARESATRGAMRGRVEQREANLAERAARSIG
ncbi:hypothetical protein I4F81_007147 [Pyropia yezoensis]|uniref:Uncharacterized protein n=1 Tax=Pyropia yezoensis TaxID=2788 RepID=A0ACC3C369_PYRYE|nr:hypothetical protein I4F81_007147 [Neopyropia yezoensis]